ncbi:NUDIX hydrolase [Yunchengibacter salinarum]|uniref:NUDIX hydrolase n=1 Tax=Yunchengibacter salinarum TaxID=3133399 RepID=UPI0035B6A294
MTRRFSGRASPPVSAASAEPAATLLLLRPAARGPEVLMVRRSERMAFAPGALVFPGGKLDRTDSNVARWRSLVSKGDRGRDLPWRIAALRELYEETGLVHADGRWPAARHASAPLDRFLRCHGGRLDSDSLVLFAHWITPDDLPRRFDTRFYLAALKPGERARHDAGETTAAVWLSPQRLLAGMVGDLMPPTRLTLTRLARFGSVGAALRHARRHPPMPIKPVAGSSNGRRVLFLPPGNEHGITALPFPGAGSGTPAKGIGSSPGGTGPDGVTEST